MKKFCLGLLLLMAASAMEVLAQSSLVATLNHNDTISVYYGIDALKSAYNASLNGDVITLSSGGFNAPSEISHEVVIRGAGMEQDSANKVSPTILFGDFNIASTLNVTMETPLTFEGIRHGGVIEMGYASNNFETVKYVQFIKCRLNVITLTNNDCSLHNARFIQCVINGFEAYGSATLINSCVYGLKRYNVSYPLNAECINCNVSFPYYGTDLTKSTFVNSVLLGYGKLESTNFAYNCIGILNDTIDNLFSNLPEGFNNICYRHSSEVYDNTGFYKLQDSIRTKCLGTDGTEVGMYGGSLPFNPQNSLPKIKKFNVASKSNAEGKLSVEIEVSAATE